MVGNASAAPWKSRGVHCAVRRAPASSPPLDRSAAAAAAWHAYMMHDSIRSAVRSDVTPIRYGLHSYVGLYVPAVTDTNMWQTQSSTCRNVVWHCAPRVAVNWLELMELKHVQYSLGQYSVSQRILPPPCCVLKFVFRNKLKIYKPHFTRIFCIQIYPKLQSFIPLYQRWQSYAMLSAIT